MNHSLNLSGGTLYFSDTGEGETVVFLHGYIESRAVWQGFADEVAKHYRVICIDLPGHGSSSVFGAVHTMDFMAEGVKEIMRTLAWKTFVLAGHSMGGYVALAYAEKYPGDLSGLSLIHSNPFADSEEKINNRDRAIELIRLGKKSQLVLGHMSQLFASHHQEKFAMHIDKLKEVAMKTPDAGIVAALEGMKQRPGREALLKKLSFPVQVIAGSYDNFIPLPVSKEMVSLIKHPHFLLLEESGHMGFIEEHEKSLGSFLTFLKRTLG
jgi:pimeloyl-ACP methyl ester carboxylesterase